MVQRLQKYINKYKKQLVLTFSDIMAEKINKILVDEYE